MFHHNESILSTYLSAIKQHASTMYSSVELDTTSTTIDVIKSKEHNNKMFDT